MFLCSLRSTWDEGKFFLHSAVLFKKHLQVHWLGMLSMWKLLKVLLKFFPQWKTTSFNNRKFSFSVQGKKRKRSAFDIFRRKSNFKLSQIACNFIFNLFSSFFAHEIFICLKINIQMQAARAFQFLFNPNFCFLFFQPHWELPSNEIMFFTEKRNIFKQINDARGA